MAGPSTYPTALERGKACLRCRRRKMRCDGVRPACGQCVRSNLEDCEYTDGGPTASQVLEQNIADLEARIRELEGSNAEVTLHDPRAIVYQPAFPSAQGPPNPVPSTETIIQAFIDHGAFFGLFLHADRFLNNLRASIPPIDQSPIPAALVHAVHLLGLVFTNDPTLKQQEPYVLSRVLHSLASALDPPRIIYVLQAEVLLTYYLFHKGRILEGGYHAAAAASIAVACKLHKLHSRPWAGVGASADVGPQLGLQLPPARDGVEEGERVRAFWNVFILDRYWSVWSRSPSALVQEASPSMEVDTPWPLEMAGYEEDPQNLIPQAGTGAQTVLNFLRGLTTESPYQSFLALRAKASILYERASRIAANWDPHSPGAQVQLQALDTRIDQFTQTLPRLEGLEALGLNQLREVLTIYTLCYCATMQLNAPKDHPLDVDTSKTIVAANAAADVLRVIDVSWLHFVDPIMGLLWGSVGQVLVAGLVSMKHTTTSSISPAVAVAPAEILIIASLNRILDAMFALRETSSLIEEELTTLRSSMTQNQAGVL